MRDGGERSEIMREIKALEQKRTRRERERTEGKRRIGQETKMKKKAWS